MDVIIEPGAAAPPTERAHALSMTIRVFKGRREVQVHLFRHCWDEAEEQAQDWSALVGPPIEGVPADEASSRRVVLESFTEAERDKIMEYLKEHYASRLTAIHSAPLEFPVPSGLPALCDMTEGKTVGFIRFEKVPHFDLDIPLRGLYDLSQHQPIVD